MLHPADLAGAVRSAARSLRRSPIHSFAAIATLTLGIGANVVICSVVRAVLLRPLPFRDPATLFWIASTHTGPNGAPIEYAAGALDFVRWKAGARTLQQVEAMTVRQLDLAGDGEPETVTVTDVSAGLFAMLGARSADGCSTSRRTRRGAAS